MNLIPSENIAHNTNTLPNNSVPILIHSAFPLLTEMSCYYLFPPNSVLHWCFTASRGRNSRNEANCNHLSIQRIDISCDPNLPSSLAFIFKVELPGTLGFMPDTSLIIVIRRANLSIPKTSE